MDTSNPGFGAIGARIAADGWLRKVAVLAMSFGTLTALCGCVRYNVVEYPAVAWDLDGRNELRISTYPSWFPRETSSIPFVYKELKTPESVHFQLFVRDIDKTAGSNQNLETVRIHTMAYELAGQTPVELLSDYQSNFWMQDQPQGEEETLPPVPCIPGRSITISVALEVNGQEHSFGAEIPCAIRKRTGSLLVYSIAQ